MITHNSARDFSAAKSKEVELLQSAHSDAAIRSTGSQNHSEDRVHYSFLSFLSRFGAG